MTGATVLNAGSVMKPLAGSGLTAKSLVVYLDSSQSVELNANTTVQAIVVATNAEVIVNTSGFTGAIAAAQAPLNSGATLTCQDGLGALGCSGCDDRRRVRRAGRGERRQQLRDMPAERQHDRVLQRCQRHIMQ